MIHGKLSLQNWRTAEVSGEAPQSYFESYNLRLFFYGTLYNKDTLHAKADDTFAHLAADAFLSDKLVGFSRLDGSFTIIYFSENECGVVRDMHGTHYSVYFKRDGEFATSFAYFLQNADTFPIDKKVLSHALQRGLTPASTSVSLDIYRLEAGCHLQLGNEYQMLSMLKDTGAGLNSIEEVKAFSPMIYDACKGAVNAVIPLPNDIEADAYRPVVEKNPDVEAYSQRYGELHRQAIYRRIGNSSRVGILLSGGYDSGSNLAALRQIYDGEIDSYSIGFKGDTWTELPMARLMSDTFGTRHHEYEIDGTEINALPDIVRFLNEPFVEGGLMVNYCAMRMIGDDKPQVILGGDGSDQYFGTSAREIALHYIAARTGISPLLRGLNNFLNSRTFAADSKLPRINFHLDKILHIMEGERFGFSDNDMCKLLQYPGDDFEVFPTPQSDIRSFAHLYTQHALVSDLKIVIDRVILYKASRMAQMFGNNLTFPFMDLELYRFLKELPVNLKCKGDNVWKIARGQFVSKYLLKHHYKPLLPEAITAKKKQGGFAPMPLFFCNAMRRAHLKDFILSSSIYDDYLNRDSVEQFLNSYDREASQQSSWFWLRQNRALQYFNLLTLVTWWEEFVEHKEVQY